jgi:hypothetical protein
MASINVEEEWKEAVDLLQSAVAEWNKFGSNEKQKLNAGELECIETKLEAIQQFAAVACRNFSCLCEFYEKFEILAVMFLLAAVKMKTP